VNVAEAFRWRFVGCGRTGCGRVDDVGYLIGVAAVILLVALGNGTSRG